MTDPTGAGDPLRVAEALEALTVSLLESLEDVTADPEAILARRAALLDLPLDAPSLTPEARRQVEAVRARVEALEKKAFDALKRRIRETQADLTALRLGRTATRSYLEEPALQPLLLDRQG